MYLFIYLFIYVSLLNIDPFPDFKILSNFSNGGSGMTQKSDISICWDDKLMGNCSLVQLFPWFMFTYHLLMIDTWLSSFLATIKKHLISVLGILNLRTLALVSVSGKDYRILLVQQIPFTWPLTNGKLCLVTGSHQIIMIIF